MSELPPCNKCGICCVTNLEYGRGGFVQVSPEDQERMPSKYRLTVVQESSPGQARLGTKARSRGWQRCVALKGIVGMRTRCGMYEDRPTLCRTFRRGGEACLQERARWRFAS